jgi:hypothetical protein
MTLAPAPPGKVRSNLMTNKKQPVSYGPGRIPRFKSVEVLAKYLDKKAREQRQEKEKKEGKQS